MSTSGYLSCVTAVGKKNDLIAGWRGPIFYAGEDGQKTQLLDSRPEKMNLADIADIPSTRLISVPAFVKNRLVAYRLK